MERLIGRGPGTVRGLDRNAIRIGGPGNTDETYRRRRGTGIAKRRYVGAAAYVFGEINLVQSRPGSVCGNADRPRAAVGTSEGAVRGDNRKVALAQ